MILCKTRERLAIINRAIKRQMKIKGGQLRAGPQTVDSRESPSRDYPGPTRLTSESKIIAETNLLLGLFLSLKLLQKLIFKFIFKFKPSPHLSGISQKQAERHHRRHVKRQHKAAEIKNNNTVDNLQIIHLSHILDVPFVFYFISIHLIRIIK
jgi:hypothetical protein